MSSGDPCVGATVQSILAVSGSGGGGTANGGSSVPSKVTHVKTTIDGISSCGNIGVGTNCGISNSGMGGIKVATSNIGASLGDHIALNTSQAGTAFRAISGGGQSTQVRVVMPPGTIMPQSMIKQLEGAAAVAASGRTQITAIPAVTTRAVSTTSITVTRPVTQTTYLPRASVTAAPMGGVGMTGGQRLVTPIRSTAASVAGVGAAVTALTVGSGFVRSAAVSRNTSSPATTVISPATSTTWMSANNTGQVQLIRAIAHQPRQRLITTQSIGGVSGGSASTNGAIVATTATLSHCGGGGGGVLGPHQQPQAIINQTTATMQAHQQQQHPVHQQQQQPQAYVATLATVLPAPRQQQQQQQQQTATLVYSSNVSTTQSQTQQKQTHQFNSTVSGQRFAVTTPFTAGANVNGPTSRQIRPIQLPKSFSAAKLNTTNISIRSPNLPQLTPTLSSSCVGAVASLRSTTVTGTNSPVVTNVIPTSNLSTTRIIQLQQPPGNGAQQIIGPSARLASNVMLQPIIVNASGGGKIGIRPPVTMAAKVQPSLTITQLGISKIPGSSTGTVSNSGSLPHQQNLTATIQAIKTSNNNGGGGGESASPSLCTVNTSTNAANLTNVSQTNLMATQNVSSAGVANVVPLAITTRGGANSNILTGTITPIKNTNGITVGKVMPQSQVTTNANDSQATEGQAHSASSVFIHHGALRQRPHTSNCADVGGGNNPVASVAVAATNVINNSTLTASGNANVATNNPGSFLPAGSTFYYESIPASSIQVSTGVLSLTTTTVTSSTLSQNHQQQTLAHTTAGHNLTCMTSLSYTSHAPVTAATFTLVPSSGVRTIGQLQLPISSGIGASCGSSTATGTIATQIQAVPVRFNAQLTPATGDGTPVAVGQSTQLVVGSSGHQILIPPPSQQQQSTSAGSHAQAAQQHMVVPLQTAIKVSSGGINGNTNSSSIVSNFYRKRDSEGSPARAAKNLAPTFLSMNSNVSLASGNGGTGSSTQHNPQPTPTIGANFNSNMISTNSTSGTPGSRSTSALNADSGAQKKERTPITSSIRTSRASSPASSEGSTTVSANSSPGIEQQMQNGANINRMPLNHQRMTSTIDSTHFNPINELYPIHHAHGSVHHQHGIPSSRNSSLDNQSSTTLQSHLIQNGVNTADHPLRKKSRRSTNDSQQSTQSQTSISLPPPPNGNTGSNIIHQSASVNGPLTAAAELGHSRELNASGGGISLTYTNHKTHNNQIILTSTTDFKENTKPTEYVLRKPRNCTLLNSYKQSWKAANNHFQRYSDIKPRSERRPTVIDLANQANVMGKINGWKIHHLRSQMEDLVENETSGYDKLSVMLKQMELHKINPDIERISELLKGNMQRSKIIIDGVNEAENQIMKIFEHKAHISDIITRCASKRNFKKRDKS